MAGRERGAIGDGEQSLAFANDFIDSMKHEVRLYDEQGRQPVLDMIDRCMEQG